MSQHDNTYKLKGGGPFRHGCRGSTPHLLKPKKTERHVLVGSIVEAQVAKNLTVPCVITGYARSYFECAPIFGRGLINVRRAKIVRFINEQVVLSEYGTPVYED